MYEEIITFGQAHWPFAAIVGVLTIIGQVTSKRVFTRKRAYQKWTWGGPIAGYLVHQYWYWMRESLPLHPIIAGGVWTHWFWVDPEGLGWGVDTSTGYGLAAGVGSLGAWMFLKAYAKHKGVELVLPGASLPPGNRWVEDDDDDEPLF